MRSDRIKKNPTAGRVGKRGETKGKKQPPPEPYKRDIIDGASGAEVVRSGAPKKRYGKRGVYFLLTDVVIRNGSKNTEGGISRGVDGFQH